MSHALERAEHYRDLAKRYLRLAASTETPNHYLRIAVQYNALAEAEEGSTDGPGAGPLIGYLALDSRLRSGLRP
jgi:hypothetical protein